MNMADMEAEYWAHRFYNDPKEKDRLVDDEWDEAAIEAEFAEQDAADDPELNNPDNWESVN